MWNVFEKDRIVIKCDSIEQDQVLMELPHVTDMGNYWQVELFCEKADRQKFADTCESCAVSLNVVNGSCFDKIFEQYPIGDVLPCCDSGKGYSHRHGHQLCS
jgi:hypothetical protein